MPVGVIELRIFYTKGDVYLGALAPYPLGLAYPHRGFQS